MSKNDAFSELSILGLFHRFERFITIGLVILISIMILAAFWGLIIETYQLLLHGAFERLDHKAFQSAFGMIMTLLIAIEFNHTIIHSHVSSGRHVIVKTVVLVSILAVARQFIVLELEVVSPIVLTALAFSLLSLGIVYWLMARIQTSGEKDSAAD